MQFSDMAVDLPVLIDRRLHALGDGFTVRRLLPSNLRRTIGPFVFLDHTGPVDVLPHPHIGLATVTSLWRRVGAPRQRWLRAGHLSR